MMISLFEGNRPINAVDFGACFVYSPRGMHQVSARSRCLRALIKSGDARFVSDCARRVRRQVFLHRCLRELFDDYPVLVPVPGSAPLTSAAPWVAQRLAHAFVREGLGRASWAGLLRACPVKKSATSPADQRPTTLNHFDSFAVAPCLADPDRIVLIDDVVTKGRTLLAAALRLRQSFPNARINAFALVRTMGLVGDVERLVQPCRGEIRWTAGDARRDP